MTWWALMVLRTALLLLEFHRMQQAVHRLLLLANGPISMPSPPRPRLLLLIRRAPLQPLLQTVSAVTMLLLKKTMKMTI